MITRKPLSPMRGVAKSLPTQAEPAQAAKRQKPAAPALLAALRGIAPDTELDLAQVIKDAVARHEDRQGRTDADHEAADLEQHEDRDLAMAKAATLLREEFEELTADTSTLRGSRFLIAQMVTVFDHRDLADATGKMPDLVAILRWIEDTLKYMEQDWSSAAPGRPKGSPLNPAYAVCYDILVTVCGDDFSPSDLTTLVKAYLPADKRPRGKNTLSHKAGAYKVDEEQKAEERARRIAEAHRNMDNYPFGG